MQIFVALDTSYSRRQIIDSQSAKSMYRRFYCLNSKVVCTNVQHFNRVDFFVADCNNLGTTTTTYQ